MRPTLIEQYSCPSRRSFLAGAAAAILVPVPTLTACGGPAEWQPATPQFSQLNARFSIPGAGQIALEFENPSNFLLAADAGPGSTIALDDKIYLHIAPSIGSFPAGRLLLTGELAPLGPPASEIGAIRPAHVAIPPKPDWAAHAPLYTVDLSTTSPGIASGRLFLAPIPELAAAQLVVTSRLQGGMDMNLCGSAIARLVATWPEVATRRGLAVIGHSNGIELVGPVGNLASKISLPPGLGVEDYRLYR